ncbi:MAG: GNAT family N-acetyltransferase [Thalassolituus sp.]|jgi:predicted GNAT family acetyltransferase|uniref:GNAT family N-acetyltransferase n=1 Tax=Thalassolituus sp. TaxID=2030822 RepID=UPI00243F3134|nr:GNAT family N-acetyltransferase [Pseudomonadota bacterium]MEC8103991.1 GNAT family N-acetyltransferase [Pseudomonadota bacterium]MEC8524832.1 GNAT family N-acetyltransferase [Pseudomonadota bacterium]MEE2749332.1 GNAT family N-acetyltransferase [Pseudomonadota bacterium]TNC84914.1 MAG: GNAT family N-acetyltransferase [Thalassolituus sp.]|tara:strand:+ start:289 stop:522 length:234 start_codon:yes stop_codon:yes gene_type:complete
MVKHESEKSRFVIEQDGKESVLDYVVSGNTVNFTHTYVPFRLRGKGLAEELVSAGLTWAKDESLDITASCSYVKKFL